MTHHDKNKIFEQAKEAIEKNKLFFVEDIVAFLPITKATFYDYFKVDSDELNELKELLNVNRVTLKVSMRSKWYKSNSPALQMALMKLIATPEELKKLAMNYTEVTGKEGGPIQTQSVKDLSDDELQRIISECEQRDAETRKV